MKFGLLGISSQFFENWKSSIRDKFIAQNTFSIKDNSWNAFFAPNFHLAYEFNDSGGTCKLEQLARLVFLKIGNGVQFLKVI